MIPVLFAFSLFPFFPVFAQPSNDSLFAVLQSQLRPEFADSLHTRLVFTHEVGYTALGSRTFRRQVTVLAQWGDAAVSRSHQDTLNQAQLRMVRRRSSPPFRGDSPQIWQKTVLPALGLATGTAVVVLLFYLRSR